jgi:hypothetical protein
LVAIFPLVEDPDRHGHSEFDRRDPDPGWQTDKKIEKKLRNFKCWMFSFWEIKAFPVAWRSFMEPSQSDKFIVYFHKEKYFLKL